MRSQRLWRNTKTAQADLVSYDVDKVPQLTFHTLIVDENQAAAMAGDPTVAAANPEYYGSRSIYTAPAAAL